jgi:hypothetical protein
VEQFYDVYVLTKQRQLPFPQQSSFRAKERLEFVHGDLCGLVTPATLGGRCYLLLLVDDISRYMWVMVLASKGEATNAIRCVQVAAEAGCGHKLHVLHTDIATNSWWLSSHCTTQMRVFSTTAPRHTTCSGTTTSSVTTRRLWGWFRLSSSRG